MLLLTPHNQHHMIDCVVCRLGAQHQDMSSRLLWVVGGSLKDTRNTHLNRNEKARKAY